MRGPFLLLALLAGCVAPRASAPFAPIEEPRTGLNFVLIPGNGKIAPFYLSTTEVTNAQFQRFRPDYAPLIFFADDAPAHMVSHEDGVAFAAWLGSEYRLPTEAEWEYACLAGATTAYSFGDVLTPREANVLPASAHGQPVAPGAARAHIVASYPPNAWGLYDMHGNVWEWCDAPDGSTVIRGGSWRHSTQQARADSRYPITADWKDPDTGFRVVRQVR